MKFLCKFGLHKWQTYTRNGGFITGAYTTVDVFRMYAKCEKCGKEQKSGSVYSRSADSGFPPES